MATDQVSELMASTAQAAVRQANMVAEMLQRTLSAIEEGYQTTPEGEDGDGSYRLMRNCMRDVVTRAKLAGLPDLGKCRVPQVPGQTVTERAKALTRSAKGVGLRASKILAAMKEGLKEFEEGLPPDSGDDEVIEKEGKDEQVIEEEEGERRQRQDLAEEKAEINETLEKINIIAILLRQGLECLPGAKGKLLHGSECPPKIQNLVPSAITEFVNDAQSRDGERILAIQAVLDGF